jgi:hypothetical protein
MRAPAENNAQQPPIDWPHGIRNARISVLRMKDDRKCESPRKFTSFKSNAIIHSGGFSMLACPAFACLSSGSAGLSDGNDALSEANVNLSDGYDALSNTNDNLSNVNDDLSNGNDDLSEGYSIRKSLQGNAFVPPKEKKREENRSSEREKNFPV